MELPPSPPSSRRPLAARQRPPATAQRTVDVPRLWFWGALGGLALCLLLLAFLLGRESARSTAGALVGPVGTPPLASPASVPALGTQPSPQSQPAGPLVAATEPEPIPASTPPGTLPPDPPEPVSNFEVARYFAQIEALQAAGPSLSNPQEFAMGLLSGSATGDTSALDELISAQQQMLDGLRSVSVPPSCLEHHRRSLDVLTSAAGVLQQVKRGIGTGDIMALTAIVPEARRMEAEARALESLAARIQRDAGLR